MTNIYFSVVDLDNQLSAICLWLEDGIEAEDGEAAHKSKLLFPNLSSLDISNNRIREIPSAIHELGNLSVFNVSGNQGLLHSTFRFKIHVLYKHIFYSDITELPPQMGLLSKLWNMNTRGCHLQEPLRSMIDSKKYKTMDVVGYLKSVLEDARPYARMKVFC